MQKLEITDGEQMQSIVVENIDGIEPGLSVLDSRQLLGHASIDIVALDANGALVLMSLGFTADEDMLLKGVEAYSWCLEYPDAIRRLYPSAQLSAAQPPRLVFVMERMPEAFHRKIKQLAVPEVDCVEFRYLDVDGTPAAYFDTIARLRRGSIFVEPVAHRVAESQAIEKSTEKVVSLTSPGPRATSIRLQKLLSNGDGKSARSERPAQVVSMAARAVTPNYADTAHVPLTNGHAPVLDAPGAETATLEAPTFEAPANVQPVEVVSPVVAVTPASPMVDIAPVAPVVAVAPIAPAIPIAVVEPVVAAAPLASVAVLEVEAVAVAPAAPAVQTIERVSLRDAMAVTESAATRVRLAKPEPTVEPVAVAEPAAPRRVSFADLAQELLGGPPLAVAVDKPVVAAAVAVAEPDPIAMITAPTAAPLVEAVPQIAIEPTPVVAAVAEPVGAVAEPVIAAAADASVAAVAEPVGAVVAEPAVAAVVEPIGAVVPEPPVAVIARPEPVTKTVSPAPTPVAAPAASAPAAPAPTAPATPAPAAPAAAKIAGLPQEFQGLNFPNDGVLTRQWMEFLNQIAAAK